MAQIPWSILSQKSLSIEDTVDTLRTCIEEIRIHISSNEYRMTTPLIQIITALQNCNSESHFKLIKAKGTVQIHPYFIADLRKGICTFLTKYLNRFIPEFKGMWIGFKNYNPVQNTGQTSDAEPLGFINLDIIIECLVLSPLPNSFIVGTVTQTRPGFIGLLVYGFFNATIRRQYIPPEFVYTKEGYQNTSSDKNIVENSDIKFKIIRLQCSPNGDLHSISGSILDTTKTGIISKANESPKRHKKAPKHGGEI